jgi:hypothetical protein
MLILRMNKLYLAYREICSSDFVRENSYHDKFVVVLLSTSRKISDKPRMFFLHVQNLLFIKNPTMDALYSEILTSEYNKKDISSCVHKLKQCLCVYTYILVALIPPIIPFYTSLLRSTTDTI